MTIFYDTNNPKFDLNSMFYDGENLVGTDTRILVVNKNVKLDGVEPNSLLTSTKIKPKMRMHQGNDGSVLIGGEDFYINENHKWLNYKRILDSGKRYDMDPDFWLIDTMYVACATHKELIFDFVQFATKLKKLDKTAGPIDSFEVLKSGAVRFDNKDVTIMIMPLLNYEDKCKRVK